MGNLPQKLNLDAMQNQWATLLNPVLGNPIVDSIILKNVALSAGNNVINHKLGRKLQGWVPVRVRSAATFYDTQDSNQTPALTLNLNSSATCVVDLLVF